MRIVAGEWKGKKLFPPRDDQVRPTSDKVKESIFSMISPDLPDAVVADLFSGTGGLGLEALSRGAKRCYFGDKQRDSFQLTRTNIAHCHAQDRAVAIQGDFTHVLCQIREKVDIFLLDPPYGFDILAECFRRIDELDLLSEEGIIVAEHGVKEQMPDVLYSFEKIKERSYGTIAVSIYRTNLED